ncbi:hypothetical protein K502DRAFT_353410, partial [Neoconidiobolus thromboides FSU 785]
MPSIDDTTTPIQTAPQVQGPVIDANTNPSVAQSSKSEEEESRLALLHKEAHKLTTEELIERV